MKKANIIIISLCLSVSILPSVVRADMISPGATAALLLIIIAPIIGIIALIAWLVIRKIKKNNDSKREPKIRA
ncbi:TPA: hypothetical protein HA351_11055 [Methanosarcinaceae archaeon]|nr:hypothetical protein [Methanosarcinaceae archaeon]